MGNQGLLHVTGFLLLGLSQTFPQGSTQGASGFGSRNCTKTLGREFITSFMENWIPGQYSSFQVQITSYSASTSVSVSVGSFEKNVSVDQGEVVQVVLPRTVEIVGSKTFSNTVRIKADKDITAMSLSYKGLSTETAMLFPVPVLGNEYYIVTPSSSAGDPEFSIMAHREPSTVEIHVKGQVTYQGSPYCEGDILNVTLPAFQGVQIQGKGDLSGTRIVSQKTVAVLAGHACTSENTKCHHVFEQLLPVCSWGRTYVIPPVPFQTKHDIVYVSASQPTAVQYWLGRQQSNASLEGGQVLPLEVEPSSPVYITASVGVQVVYYSTGSDMAMYAYDTFLINVPDVASYCLSYSANWQVGFDNYVLLVARSTEAEAVTLDKQPLRNVKWTKVRGSEFSWGVYPLATDLNMHIVSHPSSPFALLSFGTANRDGYGTLGACGESEYKFYCC
uniref:IgGFc-binding protein N-terminal domain-containing protein n=1 Tax=Sphenodon punctatus TaxID=8508 RepID=A0A8D0GPN4_SPHPU